jgi:hypothetical protein
MTIPTIRSRVDLLRLSKMLLEELLQPARRKRPEILHRWTEEERNLIVYLRLHRNWTWGEIHRTFFSSISVDAVKKAYSRVPPEARMHRASILISLIANSRNTSRVSWSTHHSTLMHLYTGQKLYQLSQPVPSLSHTKSTAETVVSMTQTTGDINGHKLLKAPDGDYEPPSHSPTPTLSNYSTLIISNKLNDASSVCSNESEYFSAEEF